MSNVLIVSPYFYPEGGGLERYALVMARELSHQWRVKVICMTRGKERVEVMDGFMVERIKPDFIVSNTPLGIRFALRVFKEVKRSDLVIAHTPVPFAADVASIASKFRGVPVIIVYHTVGLEKGSRLDLLARIYSSTLERLALRGSRIIAVSRVVRDYLKDRGYYSVVIYPPVEFGYGGSIRKEKVVLFVGQLGRYHRFKNLDILLKAFGKVSRDFPDWKLVIVGDGDAFGEYARLADELQLADRVEFKGRINDPSELAQVYFKASVLVLPSSFESFGMVVPEALLNGTPVVVSTGVGAAFLVDNGKNGIILNGISVGEVEKALSVLLSEPKLLRKMGKLAGESARSYLSRQFKAQYGIL